MDPDPASTSQPCDDTPMYAAVAARRLQWDNLLWQVPTLSMTGQAFLFTIALGSDSTRLSRSVACVLSLVMTGLSLHLMVKHRQAELTDAEWLERYELVRFGSSWHGVAWAQARQAERRPGLSSRLAAFPVWVAGLCLFGVAAGFVLLVVAFRPGLLAP